MDHDGNALPAKMKGSIWDKIVGVSVVVSSRYVYTAIVKVAKPFRAGQLKRGATRTTQALTRTVAAAKR